MHVPFAGPLAKTNKLRKRIRSVAVKLFLALATAFWSGAIWGQASGADGNRPYAGGFFPYAAFQDLQIERIALRGGDLQVALVPGPMNLSRETLLAWIKRSAEAVVEYFGKLPAADARLLVLPTSGRGVRGGTSYGYRGAASRIMIGSEATEFDLARDWILVHELVHHAFPSVPDHNHWMEEGLATYVEPIARAQMGDISDKKVWRDLVSGLPHGLPAAGDRGLDFTPTWGRTYWGGALFYLLADVEIHKRTGNRFGLQDSLRAIVAAGGNISRAWPVERIFAVGDQATGTQVLAELYAEMRDKPSPVDLDDLWRRLGVELRGNDLHFNDGAPLAQVRRAITKRRSG